MQIALRVKSVISMEYYRINRVAQRRLQVYATEAMGVNY